MRVGREHRRVIHDDQRRHRNVRCLKWQVATAWANVRSDSAVLQHNISDGI
jgi:hypothetical protein